MLKELQAPAELNSTHGRPRIGLDDASLYGFGQLIRSTEQLILDLFTRGLVSGTTHTCLGQELCQMAVVRALSDPDDVVLSNHRNHGHFLTYSNNVLGLVAEIMGRRDGVCGGYGGSQHLATGHFHSNGVQAGMTAIGVGLAMARKGDRSQGIVATVIGDGTLGEGLLYESMNLASIWQLPVLFVIEHNGIAQTTLTRDTIGGTMEGRAAAFGLDCWRLDDASPDFMQACDDVVRSVRSRRRPGLLIIDTARLGPHSKGDDLRDEGERRRIAARDPLAALGARLDAGTRERIEADNKARLKEVEAAALASPEAAFEQPPMHALRHALEPRLSVQPARAANVRTAINGALAALLESDERVVVLGEDLHEPYGGAFKLTSGLSERFAPRVVSTPISEAGITGAGIGLALAGKRPIVEIMFADFITLCMDQLYNHAVKFPGMFPDVTVPLVIRTPGGGRRGYGPTHSQSPENLLCSVPGLTVVFGSHRHNVGQLLVDAVTRWPNPTVFLEHKLLYSEAQDPQDYVPLEPHPDDLGSALFPTLSRGSQTPDVTIIAFGGMLPVVERAARVLAEEEELEVQIVSPALLSPLPRHALLEAVMASPRVVVVEESHHEFGVSAEILASLAEAGYRGRAVRIGAPSVPLAAARSLERTQLPDEHSVVARILELF